MRSRQTLLILYFLYLVITLIQPVNAQTLAPIKDSDFLYNSAPNPNAIELGKYLFFDKILSGNKDVSCASCHYSLEKKLPARLSNIGIRHRKSFYHEGIITTDSSTPSGFAHSSGIAIPKGLDNLLAAQAMLPVVSQNMAGRPGDNAIANAIQRKRFKGPHTPWQLIANRLKEIPQYVTLFKKAYSLSKKEINFVAAANALAAYQTVAFRADNSPFDQFVREEAFNMSPQAFEGMWIFYASDSCSKCHEGTLQANLQDQNTPSLRNIASTVVYNQLSIGDDIIHPSNKTPSPFTHGRPLNKRQIQNVLAFLESLTDPNSLQLKGFVPDVVPSGLSVGVSPQDN